MALDLGGFTVTKVISTVPKLEAVSQSHRNFNVCVGFFFAHLGISVASVFNAKQLEANI